MMHLLVCFLFLVSSTKVSGHTFIVISPIFTSRFLLTVFVHGVRYCTKCTNFTGKSPSKNFLHGKVFILVHFRCVSQMYLSLLLIVLIMVNFTRFASSLIKLI